MGDTALMITIISVFLAVGLILPFVNAAFDNNPTDFKTDNIEFVQGQTNLSTTDVLFSVFLIFFWTFGALPFWIDGIFLVLRIILGILIFRNIRGVGG